MSPLGGCDAATHPGPCASADDRALDVTLGQTPARSASLAFEPLVAGEAVALEFGSQASWMLVFALQVPDLAEGTEVTVDAWLEDRDDGHLWASVEGRVRPCELGPDGVPLVPYLYLVLGGEAVAPGRVAFPWLGAHADLRVRVESPCHPTTEAVVVGLQLAEP